MISPKTRLLTRDFFNRPTQIVARDLLGKCLVRLWNGQRLAGIITETEAYIGETDLGCHASAGRTRRNAVMFGPPGHAYVYFTYGMHWMLNTVTEALDFPAAVLLRAIQPIEGLEVIQAHRQGRDTRGPAKLTQALVIDRQLNGCDLCSRIGGLWIETGENVPDSTVTIGARVGLNNVPEPWKSMPWRYLVK